MFHDGIGRTTEDVLRTMLAIVAQEMIGKFFVLNLAPNVIISFCIFKILFVCSIYHKKIFKMQIFVKNPKGSDENELSLIEMQGDLESRLGSNVDVSGKFIGDLHYTKDGEILIDF